MAYKHDQLKNDNTVTYIGDLVCK